MFTARAPKLLYTVYMKKLSYTQLIEQLLLQVWDGQTPLL